jgi:hypothetical protein
MGWRFVGFCGLSDLSGLGCFFQDSNRCQNKENPASVSAGTWLVGLDSGQSRDPSGTEGPRRRRPDAVSLHSKSLVWRPCLHY